MSPRAWRTAFAVAFAASLYGLLSPGSALPPTGEALIPHVDKVEHALMFAALAYLALRSFDVPAWRVLAWASAYGAATEIAQIWIPRRSADPFDWLADTVGAALGIIAFARTRRRPNPTP